MDIWAAKAGKTTFRATPANIAATDRLAATSNGRDIVHGTRDVRAADGTIWFIELSPSP